MKLPYRLVLASQSPRRQQLLEEAGLSFEVRTREVDEVWPPGLQREAVATYLAKLKASAFNDLAADELLITADTIVCLDDSVLNKPQDRAEAIGMISRLSGRSHTVFTGVCLKTTAKERAFAVATTVHFRNMQEEEIAHYVDTFKPYDKAGSYGIQEWIGKVGITHIEGDYFNVMGLPVSALWQALKDFD